MGKRSDGAFERRERDVYPTPREALLPLAPFVKSGLLGGDFYEPCAADGALASLIHQQLDLCCVGMSDIVPLHPSVAKINALDLEDVNNADCIITNPPWERAIMHALIIRLKWIAPTWLLLDADWLFTKQAAPFIPDATHIVPIGRLRWIPGSPHAGKDNCCWVRFRGGHNDGPKFYPNW